MDMGSLRAELQLPHHFITGEDDHELDEDIMMLGSTPQVHFLGHLQAQCYASSASQAWLCSLRCYRIALVTQRHKQAWALSNALCVQAGLFCSAPKLYSGTH